MTLFPQFTTWTSPPLPNESKRNRPYHRGPWKNWWGDGPSTPKTCSCPWKAQWTFVSYAKPSSRGSHRDIPAFSMQFGSPRTSIVLDRDTDASQTRLYLFPLEVLSVVCCIPLDHMPPGTGQPSSSFHRRARVFQCRKRMCFCWSGLEQLTSRKHATHFSTSPCAD